MSSSLKLIILNEFRSASTCPNRSMCCTWRFGRIVQLRTDRVTGHSNGRKDPPTIKFVSFSLWKRAAQRNESFVVKRKRNFYELNGSEEGETRSIIGHLERCRVLAAARAALLMKGEIHRLTCVQPNRKKQMKRKETIAEPHKNDKNTTETVLSFHLAPVDSEGEIEQRGGGGGWSGVPHIYKTAVCVTASCFGNRHLQPHV